MACQEHGVLNGRCKACKAAHYKRYTQENKQRISEQRKAYYERNKETIKAKTRAYSLANRDREREWRRGYRQRNKDRANLWTREARRRNPTKFSRQAWTGHIKHKYGIGPREFHAMLVSQGGVCAICGGTSGRKRMCIDHDHKTGRIRGLLCGLCNAMLGHGRDNVELFHKAIEYLLVNDSKEIASGTAVTIRDRDSIAAPAQPSLF